MQYAPKINILSLQYQNQTDKRRQQQTVKDKDKKGCTMLTCVVVLFLNVTAAKAQEVEMSIDDMFGRVEQHNIDVKTARQSVSISAEQKRAAKVKRLPDVNFSVAANYLGDATILNRDFSNATKSEMPHFGNSISLTAYQPVYAGGRIAAGIEQAETRELMADNELTIVTDNMKMEALECYLDLFKHRNLLSVYDENIALTEKLVSEMKGRSEQGLVLANDITRYELNLLNLNYDRTVIVDGIDHLNHNLLTYLDLEESTVVIPLLKFEDGEAVESSADYWLELARQNSPELRKIDLEHSRLETEEKLVKSARRPSIGISVGDNLDGPITNRSPVVDKNLNKWWAGVQLTLNISSFYKESSSLRSVRMETARQVDRKRSQEDSIERRIDKASKQYREAIEQVRTQELNVKLATENYRIVERRYSSDLALLTDMLDASAQKLDAEVRLVNARTNVIYYHYQLKYISGTL